MKILQIHNKYRNYGGEDVVVENEYKLMTSKGFKVKQLFFDNQVISPTKFFFNKNSYKKTIKTIDSFCPDIVHIHNLFYTASVSVLMAAKSKKIKTVITLHNYRLMCLNAMFSRKNSVCTLCYGKTFAFKGVLNKCFQNSFNKSLMMSLFVGINKKNNTWQKYLDQVIVLTPFIKELILNSDLGIEENKISIKPNSTSDLQSNIDCDEKSFFLFVGRISKEKGIDILVETFNDLSNFNLEVIGGGENLNNLSRDSNSNIIFHGQKNKEFVNKKLKYAKALIFPSTWFEGLPNTIIEAFSAGVPVISSDNDNLKTIVNNNFNGLLFKQNCKDSLKEVILNFNNIDNKKLSINARKTYEKYYSHQKNFENLKAIYKKVKS